MHQISQKGRERESPKSPMKGRKIAPMNRMKPRCLKQLDKQGQGDDHFDHVDGEGKLVQKSLLQSGQRIQCFLRRTLLYS